MREHRSSRVSGRTSRGLWLVAIVVATAAAMGLRLMGTHHDASSDSSAQMGKAAASFAELGGPSLSLGSVGDEATAVSMERSTATPSAEPYAESRTVTYDDAGQPKLESVEAESVPVADHAMRRMLEVRRTGSALRPRLDEIQSVSPPASGPRLDDGLQGSGAGTETRPYLEQVAE
jgi:hypothetical protein